MQPILVGVAGGSGSGKTTVARRVLEVFDAADAAHMDMDSYYRDLSHMTMPQRREVNFDHPDAFDTPLFVEHLLELGNSHPVAKPVYDFSRSTRSEKTVEVRPAPVIVVEGIMVLTIPEVREVLDTKIFVSTDDDIRFNPSPPA